MRNFPAVSQKEIRKAWFLQLTKFPLYAFGLIYSLSNILSVSLLETQPNGPKWFTVYALCTCVSIFCYKSDLMVAAYKAHHFLGSIFGEARLLVEVAILVPLTCAGLDYAYNAGFSDSVLLPTVSSLLAAPYFALLLYGNTNGILAPFLPAAFKKELKSLARKKRT
ncbi:hypothetical protein K3725_04310 [Leisingera sp. S132]|uniref:hypothetical protein n=1 Tax=Leisingera sp. S132 TaxID=2867016 RepID=UPI0021A92EEF|nr:hypothetical protein [Leisingera sp. S132]UWQ80242.1 hypothetical protein K3725_04310 [Leisingera sp. S132]